VWSVPADPAGPRFLHVSNPTPYHVSFSGADVTVDGNTYGNHDGGMIAPGTTLDLPVIPTVAAPASNAAQVSFTWINDYGANVSAHAVLGANS
jgi:chaperone protein EcpD